MTRLEAIIQFYDILSRLEKCVGERRILARSDGRKMKWPRRGVYFFFENDEQRRTSGSGLRVVRVGTHAIEQGKDTKLWNRLRDHRGTVDGKYRGGGNHRASAFRKLVGAALLNKEQRQAELDRWLTRSSTPPEIRRGEHNIECKVSERIRSMPFLWLEVDDALGPESKRKEIEKNSIALLSNYKHANDPIDPPSPTWLGRHACDKDEKVRKSGLWNDKHVDESYNTQFLEVLEQCVNAMCKAIALGIQQGGHNESEGADGES